MTELPGAAFDRQIRELGDSMMNRTDRLASDTSHNNAEIEKLNSRATWVRNIIIVVAAIALMAVKLSW